jgi:hypothetical protein
VAEIVPERVKIDWGGVMSFIPTLSLSKGREPYHQKETQGVQGRGFPSPALTGDQHRKSAGKTLAG